MDTQQALSGVQTAFSTHPVFGAPIQTDGATLIPATSIRGGGGGGGRNEQAGAGFGLKARPVGVYVVRNGKVTWRPAVDVERLFAGGQAVLLLLMAAPIVRRWFDSRRRARNSFSRRLQRLTFLRLLGPKKSRWSLR